MTSTLGSKFAFETDPVFKKKEYDEVIKESFKPEFINRIDEIIIFNPLNRNVIKDIAGKFLGQLKNRLKDSDIELTITDKAMDSIVAEGYDETFGARPMKRHIQREIESKLARYIISNPDSKNITVDFENDDYIIK